VNLDQITTKNFILALFKRDDGERILLGAGLYEFKDGLQHFQPNTIANDIVEKQGTDGQLLAGQVLRSSAQPFDGFIGDATTTRPNIENARRAFIQYFQANHRYKVIYIMPDGTAIQRQNGYLVDAPSVPEMIQKFPTYHVALAFEDIHYYSYAENPDGSETYAQIYSIDPSGILTGGLVWVANGVEWDGPGMALNAIRGATSQASYTGKNRIKLADNTTSGNGLTVSVQDDVVTINGTASGILNITALTYNLAGMGGTKPAVSIIPISGSWTGGAIGVSLRNSSNSQVFFQQERYNGGSFNANTLTESAITDTDHAYAFAGATTVFNNFKFRMMLTSSATIETDYEPYVGGTPSPNPDYPQPIRTVTGTQTITINGTNYTLDLGSIELNDLGNGYQDGIAFDGAGWKLRKTIASQTFDGSDTDISAQGWFNSSETTNTLQVAALNIIDLGASFVGHSKSKMTHFEFIADGATMSNGKFKMVNNSNGAVNHIRLALSKTIAANLSAAQAWIATNKPRVYYKLKTPTDTTITDANLIAQLEAIKTALAAGGPVSITPSGSNLAAIIDAPANGTGGAIWEASGGTSAQPVTNNGIASAQPIWTVDGPAENPSITNETTGQTLTFTGTVPNGQALIVDCGSQTANIAGVDVKAQITGDWLTIEPGTNLITYSGASVTTPSTLKWNEVVE
jgi:hypothetical protein